MKLLQVQGLSVSYVRPDSPISEEVLSGLELELEEGGFTAINGVSGSGKSTLFRIISGLQKPSEGRVLLEGKELSSLDEKEMALVRNKDLGLIFQDHRLLPQCTALENVLLPTIASGDTAQKKAYAQTLLEQVGLSERASFFPGQLSGGQRQRVAVARALIQSPRLVLADEPTGALDRANSEALGQLLKELRQTHGLTVLCFTHSEIMGAFANESLFLESGNLRAK